MCCVRFDWWIYGGPWCRLEKLKDFKSTLIKSINKFNSYIKLDTKKKDIEKKDIEKRDIEKKDIEKKDIEMKVIKHDAKNNNKSDTELATSADIKAHIIDKQKLLKQRCKSLLETKKTIKNNIKLIYAALKKIT